MKKLSLLLAIGASAFAVGCTVNDVVMGDDQKDFPELLPPVDGPNENLFPNDCDLTGKWFVHLTANV